MNLNHLAIFHAVALEKSITRGAERLYISQPAVTKQFQELERSLGTRLLDRLPRGVRLTESGELLAKYAQRLFALESEAENALAELKGLERGRLSLGASLTIGGYLMPDILAQFHLRYPGIDVNLEIANTEAIQQRLLVGELDLAFTEGFADMAELEADVFLEDTLVVIAAPSHPFLMQPSVTAEMLCQQPFVVREAGSGTRAVIERTLEAQGLTIHPVISLGNIEGVKRAVAGGMGVAIVSGLTIGLEKETGTLAVIPIIDLSIRRPLHRLRLKSKHQSFAARAFLEILSETIIHSQD